MLTTHNFEEGARTVAKKKDEGNQSPVSGEDVAPEQRDAEGNPSAAKEGESDLTFAANEGYALEDEVNELTPAEEAERQQAEQYPHIDSVTVFDPSTVKKEKARVGHGATHRAEVGRVVVVLEETMHDGELYRPGVGDLPLEVADALIDQGVAYEPAGKKKGR